MLIDNPFTSAQMLLVVFWMVLWMIYDWYNELKLIEWQDGWYEMFDIVDFAMLSLYSLIWDFFDILRQLQI